MKTAADGQGVYISATGDVFWTQRMRLTLSCPMDFWTMPYDEHDCPIKFGLYRSTASQVIVRWKNTSGTQEAVVFDEGITMSHWFASHDCSDSQSKIVSYAGNSDSYSSSVAYVKIARQNSAMITFVLIPSLLFVIASYSSFYINPAAAPGRIALGFLCFLMVQNSM